MRPLVIVVPDKLRYFFLPRLHVSRNSGETVVLKRLDKSFDVSVVGRRPDSAVAMNEALMFDGFRKPLGKLLTVIRLDSLKFKGSDDLSSFDKLSAQQTVGL